MSYDLFFKCSEDSHPREHFFKWFAQRKNYELTEDGAEYHDTVSQVYFRFNYEADTAETDCWASFNINFLRPHFFVNEAAGEIEAFIEEFKLTIDDPQNDGMGEGPFTAEGMKRGWETGNVFAIRSIVDQGHLEKFLTLPSAELERIWYWNHANSPLRFVANATEASTITPQVFVIDTPDGPCTAAYWQDGMPVFLPKVDFVCLVLSAGSSNEPDALPNGRIIPFDELPKQALAKPYEGRTMSYYDLVFEERPAWVEKLFKFPKKAIEYTVVGPQELLDAEYVDEALSPPKESKKHKGGPPRAPAKTSAPKPPPTRSASQRPPTRSPSQRAAAVPPTRSANQRPGASGSARVAAVNARSGSRQDARGASGTRRAPAKKKTNWLGIVGLGCGTIIILGVAGLYLVKEWGLGKVEVILQEKGRMSIQNRQNYTKFKTYYDKQLVKFHKDAWDQSLAESRKGTITGEMDLYYVGVLAKLIATQAAKDGEKDVEQTMLALHKQCKTGP